MSISHSTCMANQHEKLLLVLMVVKNWQMHVKPLLHALNDLYRLP